MKNILLKNIKFTSKIIFIFTIIVALYCVSFVHYDDESDYNTYKVNSTIRNAKYDSDHYKSVAIFTTDYGDFYYKFYDRSKAKEDFDRILYIQENNINVQLTISKEKDFANLISLDGLEHVVEIKSENIEYFSINDHNADQRLRRVVYSTISTLLLLMLIGYCWIMKHLK